MFETLRGALALAFILCGFFFILYAIFQKIISAKSKRKTVTLIMGFPNDERLPEEVYSAYLSSNLLNFTKKNAVIVLDFGVEKSVKDACRYTLGDDESVFFYQKEDFEEIIRHLY